MHKMFFGGAYLWAIWAILLFVKHSNALAFPCIATCGIRMESMLLRSRRDFPYTNAYAGMQSRRVRLLFSEFGVGIRTFLMQMDDQTPEATPPRRYGPETFSVAEFVSLRRRVVLLETLVAELCGALLYSDDMSMMERHTAEIGSVYRDISFSECRQPAFARQRIEEVLQSYNIVAKTRAHRWVAVRMQNTNNITRTTNTTIFTNTSTTTNASTTTNTTNITTISTKA